MNKVFDEYVSQFDLKDPKIRGKKEHSYRVMELSTWLSKKLELGEEDCYLATIIGLLHDIGRFEQVKQYQSFNDAITVDHGDLGSKILFQDGWIRKFLKDSKYDIVIEKAVRNHNKVTIEKGLTEQEQLQTDIIRDADKLDIFYNIACLNQIVYPKSEEQISDIVKHHFQNHELVSWKEIQNSNDNVIKTLCFVFDLNFKESFLYLKEQHYLDDFERKLDNEVLFQPYFEALRNYIEERIR